MDPADQTRTETALERLVKAIHQAEEEWMDAKEKSELLSEGKKHFFASLQAGVEKAKGAMSEAKLERLASASDQWDEYITGMVTAKIETERRGLRREGLVREFDRLRSKYVTQRATNRMQAGTF